MTRTETKQKDDMTETEQLQEEIRKLKAENERLKAWNKAFFGRIHYYFFEALMPWKEAPGYSEQKRKLTAKCRSIEDEIVKELKRVDNGMTKRNTDVPADVDRPTAVQKQLEL